MAVNKIMVLIILQLFILLTAPLFYSIYAAGLYESNKDLTGIAESEPKIYQQMVDAGAKTLIVKGRKPFLVYWIPNNFNSLPKHRILVVMHGTNGNAYHHLSNFLNTAKEYRFGILSVQWGWPTNRRGVTGKPQYRYIQDVRKTYTLIDAGLMYLSQRYGITQGESAWQGFSRSSTQCAVFAHLDKNEGKKYFALFIAASGGIGENLPIMRELFSGKHGVKPLKDQHFYLWGGKRDLRHGEESMRRSQAIIEQLGGTVDILRIGSEGHGGFNHNRQYQEEAWRLWDSLCKGK